MIVSLAGCITTQRSNLPGNDDRMGAALEQSTLAGDYLSGSYAIKERDFQSASDYLLRSLALDPQNPQLIKRAFFVFLYEGKIDQALLYAEQILTQEDDFDLADFLLALRDTKQGSFVRLRQFCDRLDDTGHRLLLKHMVNAWAWVDEDANKAYAQMHGLKDKPGFEGLYYLQMAVLADYAGDIKKAEGFFEKSLQNYQAVPLRLVELAGPFYERIEKPEKAQQLYDAYIARKPNNHLVFLPAYDRLDKHMKPQRKIKTSLDGLAESIFNLATAFQGNFADELSLIYAQMALYVRPDHDAALLLVGDIYRDLEQYDYANLFLEKILPDPAYGWNAKLDIIRNYESAGNRDLALGLLNDMILSYPDHAGLYVLRGEMFSRAKEFTSAIASFDQAIALLKDPTPDHWAWFYARGVAFEQANQWARAEQDFLQALQLNPNQPFVLNYLGYSWVDRGMNLKIALKMIEKAVILQPADGYIIDSLGWAYYRLGRYDDAVPYIEKAVEIRPYDSVINDHLGDVYWKIGRYSEANFQWKRAINLTKEQDKISALRHKIKNGLPPTKPDTDTAKKQDLSP